MKKSRNQKILEFIKAYKDERGVSPSNKDIRDEFGISSSSVVHYALDALEEQGCIKRTPHEVRTMKVLAMNYDERLLLEDK